MALHVSTPMTCSTKCLTENTHLKTSPLCLPFISFVPRRPGFSISSSCNFSLLKSRQSSPQMDTSVKSSKAFDLVLDNKYEDDSETDIDTDSDGDSDHESPLMSDERTREEMREKLRQMIDHVSTASLETDEEHRKEKVDNLLRDYSLVVDEEDPEWREEYDEGWGFNLSDFFNKIEITNDKNDDDEDEGYDSSEDIVWQDDNYIKPIKEITAKDWEHTVFVDFNPLVILVHNRYRRPRENEKARHELVKAIEIIWQSGVPSPRCVGLDACLEQELVNALKITTYPEIIFTKAGKILHRDKVVRTAREWSQMMGFFYYKASRPPCLDKNADIFEVVNEDGTILVMKLHRLGRVSFRAVKSKRDYLKHRRSYNWLYLSRLAAIKEFAFMKALGEHGFPVPTAIEGNRHCVVMSLVQGYQLVQVKQLQNPDDVFETIISLIVRLAEHGLIHCDFNEFNIMIDDNENITMIDFPQMVSVSHRNAKMYFDRDIECVFKFFRKRFNLSYEEEREQDEGSGCDANEEGGRLCFSSIEKSAGLLDEELAASGFTKKDQENIQKYIEGEEEDSNDDESEEDDDDSEEDDDDSEDDLNDEGDKPSVYELVGIPASSSKMANEPEGSSGFIEVGAKDSWVPGDGEDGDNLSDAGESENDEKLAKRLNKERKRAIASAHGRRKPVSSRNSYKDKGRKSSLNSKVQRQALKW